MSCNSERFFWFILMCFHIMKITASCSSEFLFALLKLQSIRPSPTEDVQCFVIRGNGPISLCLLMSDDQLITHT